MDATASSIRDPVRVLYVLDHSDVGPTTDHLSKLVKRLKRMQLTPVVLTMAAHGDGTERIQAQDVPVVSLDEPCTCAGRGVLGTAKAVIGLRGMLRKFRPDVVHVMGSAARMVSVLAALREPDVRIVVSAEEATPIRGLRQLGERWSERALLPLTLVPDRDVLARLGPEARRSHALVGHGVDISAARSAALVGLEALPAGAWYVGLPIVAGATESTRRMLEAFRIFSALRPDARLVVCASAEEANLAPWDEDFGIKDRILHHPIPAEPASLLRRLSVLWVDGDPAPDQSMILSAMAVGVPVVCHHATGLAPFIRDVGGALMRDGAWPAQFAEATRDLAVDPGLAANVGAGGRAVVERDFGMAGYAERIRAVYGWLVHGGVRPPFVRAS